MKIKKEFTLRNIGGESTLVPVGDTAESFKGLIKINDVGSYIWNNLEKVNTEEEIVSILVENCGLELNEAQKDVKDFLEYLKNVDIL